MMEQDDGARMVENVGLEWGTQIVEWSVGVDADFSECATLN